MEKEIWKNIEELDNKYQVSSFGRIKALDKYYIGGRSSIGLCHKKEHIIKQRIKESKYIKYLYVSITLNKKVFTYRVARLVGKYFLNNFDNNKDINHKDKNTLNNNVNNLECIDHYLNIAHRFINQKTSTNLSYIYFNKKRKWYEFKKSIMYKVYRYGNKNIDKVIKYRNKFLKDNNLVLYDTNR